MKKRTLILWTLVAGLTMAVILASPSEEKNSPHTTVVQNINPNLQKKANLVTSDSEKTHRIKSKISLSKNSKEKPSSLETVDSGCRTIEQNYDPYADEQYFHSESDDEGIDEQLTLQSELTHDELAVQEKIGSFENQMMHETDNFAWDDENAYELRQFFGVEDHAEQQKHSLVDLHCANEVCRLLVIVSNAQNQYELMDDLAYQLYWLEQSYVDVTVNADDSRMVVIYLTNTNAGS